MKIGIIILAAGGSSRLGTPKQLIKIEEESLIKRTVKIARQIQNVERIVVLGANEEKMRKEIEDVDIPILYNESWQSGMASSLKNGLLYLQNQNPDLEAVIVMLCDQPFVTEDLILHIIQTYLTTSKSIVVSDYGIQIGVPALFTKSIFEDILQLQGDMGARKIIQKYMQEAALIPFPDGRWDIDTPEDIEIIKNILNEKKSSLPKHLE